MKTELDVPENNQNGRVWFHLIPDSNRPDRTFYNKPSWSAIKRMAAPELEEAFGWSLEEKTGQGRSISGNLGNIIATEEDFYREYGVDMEAEKAKTDSQGNPLSFKDIKKELGMFGAKKWQPVIKRKLAGLFLALERAWQRTSLGRLELLHFGPVSRPKKPLPSLAACLPQPKENWNLLKKIWMPIKKR